MATIELNVDGYDIAHETPRQKKSRADMTRAGWRQQFTLVGGSPVAQIRRNPIDRGAMLHAPASAREEAIDDCGLVCSALVPQCP